MPHTSKKILQKKGPATRLQRIVAAVKLRIEKFLSRRPHRSFQLTRRRDYRRSLQLPGYFAFTSSVNKTLWKNKRIFIWLAVVYAIGSTLLVGIGSQETYSSLTSTLQDTSEDISQGQVGDVGKASLLFVSIAASGLNGTPTEAQQIYIVILALLIWLATVWLLRNLLAGHKIKMRDGLYNAGAPIVSMLLVTIVFALQLIPIAVAAIGYSAANSTGLLAGGVEAMLFWIAAGLLTIMSLYWITSTFFALIIVSLPGMYPGVALRSAGDMVVGRRLRILLRILWMFAAIIITAAIILIPTILIDTWLTKLWPFIDSVPVVPFVLMLTGVVLFIWGASYIYLLYRKVVDDDAKAA